MKISIPSAESVQASIADFNSAQLRALGRLSGVPFTTLWKIKAGETKNPGVETVRAFFPHVRAAKQAV